MKRLVKPEIDFIKLENVDVITTSVGDTYQDFDQNNPENTTNNAHDDMGFSGGGSLWNYNQ